MNTPLMELIEWIKNDILEAKHVIDNNKDYDIETVRMADHYYRSGCQIRNKATELLEKEREVIIDSYNYGRYDGEDGNISQFKSGQDYFTKTFTDESK